jgi:hypothetical protein
MTYVNAIESAIITNVLVGGKYPLLVVSCNLISCLWTIQGEYALRRDNGFCQSNI